mmetsp:Transcript_25615/g.66997  ORF Transcript_25615/g.66997 Transcript_25615/m.66997 type:complete len:205 (-) Transcript_25615:333-947(-)
MLHMRKLYYVCCLTLHSRLQTPEGATQKITCNFCSKPFFSDSRRDQAPHSKRLCSKQSRTSTHPRQCLRSVGQPNLWLHDRDRPIRKVALSMRRTAPGRGPCSTEGAGDLSNRPIASPDLDPSASTSLTTRSTSDVVVVPQRPATSAHQLPVGLWKRFELPLLGEEPRGARSSWRPSLCASKPKGVPRTKRSVPLVRLAKQQGK